MYVVSYEDKYGTWYFKKFELSFPCWVGKKKMKEGEVRKFETKTEARAFIRGMLNNRRKYKIEEVE